MSKRTRFVRIIATVFVLGACTTLYGAAITTSILCSDAPPPPGATSCSGPHQTAASFTVTPTSVTSSAQYGGGGTPDNYMAGASATFEADYVLTVHGGVGLGRFVPCLTASSTASGSGSSSASVVFGTFSAAAIGFGQSNSTGCTDFSGHISPSATFQYDVPQIFHLRLATSSHADSLSQGGFGSSSASIGAFHFANLDSLIVTGATFTLTEVPEPSTLLLSLPVGLFACWRRRAFMNRHQQC